MSTSKQANNDLEQLQQYQDGFYGASLKLLESFNKTGSIPHINASAKCSGIGMRAMRDKARYKVVVESKKTPVKKIRKAA